jgi:RimJ/RimL family protein N-acetyltransferase
MSEPKGPFDTSLTVLRYGIGDGEDFEAAIRVLEAAGKVEKAELRDFIHLYLADLDPNPILEFMETVYMALPDEEKRCE